MAEKSTWTLILYRTRPVEFREQVKGGIRLTYANTAPGQKKVREVVTQEDWDRYGVETRVNSKPDLRELARQHAKSAGRS